MCTGGAMGSARGPVGSTERTGGPLGMHWSPYLVCAGCR